MFNRYATLPTFFSDFGVDVVKQSGVSIKGILDKNDDDFQKARVNTVILRVRTSDVTDVDTEAVLQYNGTMYRVYAKYQHRDGAFTKLWMEPKRV
jgi:hypothetical protein